jgi:tol-pal system protein YbgF
MKRKQVVLLLAAAMVAGAVGGTLFSPAPVGAVAKEMIELLTGVNQIQQSQRDMQSSLDTKFTVLKTLIDQQGEATSKLNISIGALQKTMQDLQANSGAQLNSMTTQVQGVSDNMGEIQQRLGKINSQLTDLQGTLQTLDAKVSTLSQGQQPVNPNPAAGTASSTPPGTVPANTTSTPTNPPQTAQPPASQTLYNNALNDILTKKYDLAQQEFQDYVKYYPTTDYASNAVFYLGEIAFVQQRYPEALDHYTDVISNFPKSFKLGPALYKRGLTYIELGKKPNGIADLREVIRRHPNSDEEKLARAKLRDLGVAVTAVGR